MRTKLSSLGLISFSQGNYKLNSRKNGAYHNLDSRLPLLLQEYKSIGHNGVGIIRFENHYHFFYENKYDVEPST